MEEDLKYIELAMSKLDEIETSLIETVFTKDEYAKQKELFDFHIQQAWLAAYKLKCSIAKEIKQSA